ncbi:hypothetical protein [Ammoniphilus sp. 3BR4]|uniref:hypothetical protein n=1 Tax=Ammoniphilus sp. 3BR4 TaxID=3158265 RepID=UPI0034665091
MSLPNDNLKDEMHRIIDSLPPEETIAARHYLKYLLDEALRKRKELRQVLDSVPYDDEPVSKEDATEIENARKEIEAGETVSLDEVRRKLGL